MRSLRLVGLVGLLVLGCGRSPQKNPRGGSATVDYLFPAGDFLDIAFLLDDSASTDECTTGLIRQFPILMQALRGRPQGLPDLHIGITTSSLGAGRFANVPGCESGGLGGAFQNRPTVGFPQPCTFAPRDSYIISAEGGTKNNFSGTIEESFACIGEVCCGGCGFEHPLAALQMALAGSVPENAGFLREGSLLGVWICQDEDDCSAPPTSDLFDPDQMKLTDPYGPLSSFRCTEFGILCNGAPPPRTMAAGPLQDCRSNENGKLLPVADFVRFFDALRPRETLVATVLAAPPAPFAVQLDGQQHPVLGPSCTSANGSAFPAVRLHEFARGLGGRAETPSICSDSYATQVARFGERLVKGLARCIAEPPAGCAVSETSAAGASPLSRCAGDAGPQAPCWEAVEDSACAPGRSLRVRWGGPAPAGSRLEVRCQRS